MKVAFINDSERVKDGVLQKFTEPKSGYNSTSKTLIQMLSESFGRQKSAFLKN